MAEKKRVLIICLGNICRSPMGEAVFQHFIRKQSLEDKWEVESAGLIGCHTGQPPDRRTMYTLRDKGIIYYTHKSRPITKDDFETFDWIFGMDNENISHLNRMKPQGSKAKIELLGKYDPEGELIIRDPYYDTNSDGFVKACDQCMRSIASFLEEHRADS